MVVFDISDQQLSGALPAVREKLLILEKEKLLGDGILCFAVCDVRDFYIHVHGRKTGVFSVHVENTSVHKESKKRH